MSDTGQKYCLGDAIDQLDQLSVQQLRCHRIDADLRRLVPLSPDELRAAWESNSAEFWVDIQATHPNEFRQFLEPLNLHPLILADCLDPDRSSRFSSYDSSLHFELPVFTDESTDHYLSVICVPRLLITIRTSPISEVDGLLRDLEKQTQLNEGTKSALLYAVLDALSGRLVQAATRSREDIRQISRSLDSRPDSISFDEIVSVKRRVQDIATIAEDQLYCIGALVSVDSDAFPISNQRDYLRDASRNYEAALRVLHRHEARAAELHQQYLSSLQIRTESRIRILTILSSICMPLTLIAGVYGMNFSQMPELQVSWGYPATLAGMLMIALGQIWFFHRRGWFR